MVMVFDDVTPLVRAQKVAAWREVARRLAHEIKNPLTPIQLSRRAAAPALRARRRSRRASWWTSARRTIVGEVESLKGLVDEFSQFARMPAPRAVLDRSPRAARPTCSALYQGIFTEVELPARFADALPKVFVDPEQIRRVIRSISSTTRIEAMDRRGRIDIETQHDGGEQPACASSWPTTVPAFPPAERDKLFLPYYSTKQRGSGLGLAIVRRIVAEHGGSIEVTDNAPRGTRFAIELPC